MKRHNETKKNRVETVKKRMCLKETRSETNIDKGQLLPLKGRNVQYRESLLRITDQRQDSPK